MVKKEKIYGKKVILLIYVGIVEIGLLLTIARMIVVIVRASVEVMQL